MNAPLPTTIRACATVRSLAGVVEALTGDSYISSSTQKVGLAGYVIAPDNGESFDVFVTERGIEWSWRTELGMSISGGVVGINDSKGAHELVRNFKLWVRG